MSLVEDNSFLLNRRRTQGHNIDSIYSNISACPSMTSSSPSLDSASPAFSDHRRGSLASSSSWNETGSYPSSSFMSMSPQTPCPQTIIQGVSIAEPNQMSLGWVSMEGGEGPNGEYLLGNPHHEDAKVNDGLGFYQVPQHSIGFEQPQDMWSYPMFSNVPQQSTGPCLSMPMFNSPQSVDDGHASIPSWLPYGINYQTTQDERPMHQRTIEPSLISDAVPSTPLPVTPSPSYGDYPTHGMYTRTPTATYMDGSPMKRSPSHFMIRSSVSRRSYDEMNAVHSGGIRKSSSSSRINRNNKKVLCKKGRSGSWADAMDEENFSKADCIYEKAVFLCKVEGCPTAKAGRGFKRQEHLKRHERSCHSDGPKHPCWVPGCDKLFDRTDNLNAHRRTHAKKKGRNRYVATLDPGSTDYDPEYRGPLTIDGRPDRSGQQAQQEALELGWGDNGANRRRHRR